MTPEPTTAQHVRVITRSGEHLMNSYDRYQILLDDDTRETRRAEQLQPGQLLLGAGRIISVERLDTQGTA